jgi:hypothetical protein
MEGSMKINTVIEPFFLRNILPLQVLFSNHITTYETVSTHYITCYINHILYTG